MPDFNQATPPIHLTNPAGAPVDPRFPRHVHKWAGVNEDGSPKLNDYVVVTNDAELEQRLAEGWNLQPVMVAPDESKKPESKKPESKKPGKKE